MGIADAEYKFLYVDIGCNGRISDGGVFGKCSFAQAMHENRLNFPPPLALPHRQIPMPYVLVADDAFALEVNLMKPFPGRNLNTSQRVFNYRLSRARRIIENAFGIMAARFRVMRSPINLDAAKTRKVTIAVCALHNYLITRNKANYAPPTAFDRYSENGELIQGSWRAEIQQNTLFSAERDVARYTATDAINIRIEFQHYFMEEGEVSWQMRYM